MKRKQEPQLLTHSLFQYGRTWSRGPMIGSGSFGSVYLVNMKKLDSRYSNLPSVMAVKSAEASVSRSLRKEKYVLNNLQGCPYIIQCFGEDTTVTENGDLIFNVFLEYASGGTIADLVNKSRGRGLHEDDVRRYTRSILEGLKHVHECDYVHCDLKPENILLVPITTNSTDFVAKIGDFGLAKRAKQGKRRNLRGTLMYLSPETVVDNIQEPPSDIWALGCVVLVMLTGKRPWEMKPDMDVKGLMNHIGSEHESPNIPNEISKEAKDFLKHCFVRKPMYRFTAEMLLNHPFVARLDEQEDRKVRDLEKDSDAESVGSSLSFSTADLSFIPIHDSPFSSLSEEGVRKRRLLTSSSIIPKAIMYF